MYKDTKQNQPRNSDAGWQKKLIIATIIITKMN